MLIFSELPFSVKASPLLESESLYHGCLRISSMVMRLSGLGMKILAIKSLASSDKNFAMNTQHSEFL